MKTQYVTDANGKKVAVILPHTEYEKLLDEVDELESIKACDKAKSRKQEFAPASTDELTLRPYCRNSSENI